MVGTELLWMPGITAIVLREGADGTEVLLVRRSDNGQWTPVTGIVDPGEDPHVTAVREVLEEACVVVEVERARLGALDEASSATSTATSGSTSTTFLVAGCCSGEPRPGDDESTDAGWFPLDGLPDLAPVFVARIACAVANDPDVRLGA